MQDTMQTAVVTAPRTLRFEQVPVPVPAAGEALVQVLACGICGSDQNAWQGVPGVEYPLPPGAPGHEVWGRVAAVGPGVSDVQSGQCVTGLLQGGYAPYALATAEHLVAVPDALGAGPLLGEPLACAANVVRRTAWQPDQPLAVVGFGYLAALVVRLLFPDRQGGWIAISRREDSRQLALSLGAEAAYGFDNVPPSAWDSFPVVLEAAGVQQALDYATWLTAYGGRLVIAGYHADGSRTVNMQSWNWKGIDVINAHERRPEVYLAGLRQGLETVARHRLDLSALISHRFPLADLAHALDTAAARPPGYVKGIVQPWA